MWEQPALSAEAQAALDKQLWNAAYKTLSAALGGDVRVAGGERVVGQDHGHAVKFRNVWLLPR